MQIYALSYPSPSLTTKFELSITSENIGKANDNLLNL